MTLSDYYKTANKPFKVIDDISLEDYTEMEIMDKHTPLAEDWHKLTVTAIEDHGEYIAVYISL